MKLGNLLLLLLTASSSFILSERSAHKGPKYTCDAEGRTLIFRTHLDKLPFVGGILCLGLIPAMELCAKKPIALGRRIAGLILEVPFGCMGGYIMYSHFFHYYRFNKPLIILDNKGIWHESWKKTVPWSDVTEIEYGQRHEYITHNYTKYYLGYSWQITLHTKQKEKCLIDARLTEQLHDGPDPEKNITRMIFGGGGLVGKLIRESYSKYKRLTANLSDNPIVDSIPTLPVLK